MQNKMIFISAQRFGSAIENRAANIAPKTFLVIEGKKIMEAWESHEEID